MLLSLRFSLDTSLFPEGIISLFHFRLTFLVEIGTMKHDVKFARCKYPARGAQGTFIVIRRPIWKSRYTLWSITTHLKPACVAICAWCCFVMDNNATILFFFFINRTAYDGLYHCFGLRDCSLTRARIVQIFTHDTVKY